MFSYRQNASGQTLLRQLRHLQYPTVQRPLWPSYQHPLRRSSIQSLLSRFLFSSCVFFLWADKKLHCFINTKLLPRYNIWIFKNKPALALDSIQFRSTPPVSNINSFKSRGVPPRLTAWHKSRYSFAVNRWPRCVSDRPTYKVRFNSVEPLVSLH